MNPIVKERYLKRIGCHFDKKNNSYYFTFDGKLGLMLKNKNNEIAAIVSSEKKFISKASKFKKLPVEATIKKAFHEFVQLSQKPNPEFSASFFLFVTLIVNEAKELRSLFEWKEFTDPFLDCVNIVAKEQIEN